jgi:hypothetical protein
MITNKLLTWGSRSLVFSSLLIVLMLAGCGKAGGTISSSAIPATPGTEATSTLASSVGNDESVVTFTLSGAATGSYTVDAASPTSKLRHGHREFTIDVAQAKRFILLAFYGYAGPGTYTLSEVLDGGDVHIALGQPSASWDLSLQPTARCTMTISSDVPTSTIGLDRMKGSFACPRLLSSTPGSPQLPVAVRDGSFDVAIVVES